jgi:hypothetical protein
MEKLRELKNYMGLQMYYFKNAVSETKQDAVTEAKNIYKDFVGKLTL